MHVLPACAGDAEDAEVSILTSVLLSREEKEEDEGRPLQAALQEELHSAAGGGGENISSLCTVC